MLLKLQPFHEKQHNGSNIGDIMAYVLKFFEVEDRCVPFIMIPLYGVEAAKCIFRNKGCLPTIANRGFGHNTIESAIAHLIMPQIMIPPSAHSVSTSTSMPMSEGFAVALILFTLRFKR
jgi:hypothetical protein